MIALKNKKAFFFLVDATLAVLAIVVGSILIYSAFYGEPSLLHMSAMSESIIVFYATTTFNDVSISGLSPLINCDEPPCPIDDLNRTYAEQMYRFFVADEHDHLRSIIANTSARELPVHLNMLVRFDDELVFNTSDYENAQNFIPVRTLVMYVDDHVIQGPGVLEVAIW